MSGELTEEDIERYSRHIILKDVGGKGQKKLKNAKVFLVGAGGLGCPSSFYLAAAGIGTLGIVDSDTVDLSNLQRQILHSTNDIGKLKVDSAKETLSSLNPHANIITYKDRLNKDNIVDIIKEYDVVIDGSDNFATRYLVNDACYFAKKPLVSGAVLQFEGQLLFIDSTKGPCYRCVSPEPPPPDFAPSCQEAGVLGVVPGVIGVLQASLAINYVLGIGDLLEGKRMIYDAKNFVFDAKKIKKDPNCELCGDNPIITGLLESYTWTCSI